MVSNWKQLWNETVAGLAAGLAAIEFKRARALLVPPREPATACSPLWSARPGVQAVELHAMRISWGTYQDDMCRWDLDEGHCNAHANSMVQNTY